MTLLGVPKGNETIYEVIKREDMIGAFQTALSNANALVLGALQDFIDFYAAVAPASLWTWGQTSRWDMDMWW